MTSRLFVVFFAMLCFIGTTAYASGPLAAVLTTDSDPQNLQIVVVGDTGFNSAGARVSSKGGFKRGVVTPVDTAIAGIRHELEADIVLANLETAVTTRNDLSSLNKRFVFRTHPDAIADFLAAGINAFSLANNHAMDYRQRGAGETLKHLAAIDGQKLLAYPGLGRTRQSAAAPHEFVVNDAKVAAASIGIGGWGLPAGNGLAGQLQYPDDFADVTAALAAADADVSMLSVHYGREFQPATPAVTRQRFRQAISPAGLTIISGHHKHIANGVELVRSADKGTGVVFYGLGNFLHLGMQDMGRHDICHDYGLLGRVSVFENEQGAHDVASVRVVPLTDMHMATRPLEPEAGALRIATLNYLSRQLTSPNAGATGLEFTPQTDGSGLWCNPAVGSSACDVQTNALTVPPLSTSQTKQIKTACGRILTR